MECRVDGAALHGFFEESLACIYRPTVVTEDFLADPPRRVAQMKAEARRHLKVKLAAYWDRVRIDHDDLDIYGRDEEDAATSSEPPSRFDSAERHGV